MSGKATSEVRFTHYDSESVGAILSSVVQPLYVSTHQDVIADAFYDPERFAERVRGYARSPGFELVAAHLDGQPVGLALGYTLPSNARWWQGLTTPVDAELIAENGVRTFALNELMVHPDFQHRGLARALHDELLDHRTEARATLLVREDNQIAQAAYTKWGWVKIGKLQPFPDSPHYDALILEPLPRVGN